MKTKLVKTSLQSQFISVSKEFCHGSTSNIQCPSEKTISIGMLNCGANATEACPDSYGNSYGSCTNTYLNNIVTSCDGQSTCSVSVTDFTYLAVSYACG